MGIENKNVGLRIKPTWRVKDDGTILWWLKAISDSTWGSDPIDGRSVAGYILYFMGVPISWKSKTMNGVKLSSTEAEYCAASEVVKEIKFVIQILENLGINVELPVKVYVDNIGAIHIARNNQSGTATRHINMRVNYVREVQGTLIELVFVRSKENEAGMMTKNPTGEEHNKHSPKLVTQVPSRLLIAEGVETETPKVLEEEKEKEDVISFTQKNEENMRFKHLTKGLIYASAITAGVMCFTEVAYAKFDIDAGVAAATDPLIKGIKDHWGKGVMLTGGGAALFGEGDGSALPRGAGGSWVRT